VSGRLGVDQALDPVGSGWQQPLHFLVGFDGVDPDMVDELLRYFRRTSNVRHQAKVLVRAELPWDGVPLSVDPRGVAVVHIEDLVQIGVLVDGLATVGRDSLGEGQAVLSGHVPSVEHDAVHLAVALLYHVVGQRLWNRRLRRLNSLVVRLLLASRCAESHSLEPGDILLSTKGPLGVMA